MNNLGVQQLKAGARASFEAAVAGGERPRRFGPRPGGASKTPLTGDFYELLDVMPEKR